MHVFTKPKFWTKYSLIILIVVGVLSVIFHSADPAYDGLEDYLNNSGDIKGRAGDIINYKVVNTRYVSKTSGSNRYNEYRLRIVGTLGAVDIDVRADYLEDEKDWGYSVVRFYDE